MHELEITHNILSLALSEAHKEKAKKISKIDLVVGQMSGIEPDCVSFFFDFISKDTIAQGAILQYQLVETKVICQTCGYEFSLKEEDWSCPNCRSSKFTIISGKELYIESIEVD